VAEMFEAYGAPGIHRGWLWALRGVTLLFIVFVAGSIAYMAIADDDSRLIAPAVPGLLANALILWGLRENPPEKYALALLLGLCAIPAAYFSAFVFLGVGKVFSNPSWFSFARHGLWAALLLLSIVQAVGAMATSARMREQKSAGPSVWGMRACTIASMVILLQPLWWQVQAVWVLQYMTNLIPLLSLFALVMLNAAALWGLRKPQDAQNREMAAALRLAIGTATGMFGYAALSAFVSVGSGSALNGESGRATNFRDLLIPLAVGLLPFASTAMVIRVYYLMKPEADDKRTLMKGFGGAFICLLLTGILTPNLIDGHRRGSMNDASAVGSLRSINTAEVTYASTYGGNFSRTVKELGPPPAGEKPSAAAADLLDGVLANGRKRGFVFAYTPGPADAGGEIRSYSVVAIPVEFGKTSSRSFYTDETGVIRSTFENRPAKAKDPPI